jgi:hypothetical protein
LSHLKERKEQNCLNCNAQIYGTYCHICGQENTEAKESFWHLISHFFKDITHFDGKFFSTIKLVITKPGYLPKEYIKGKRASYLNPIRMYIFTSAFFFLIFFSLVNIDDNMMNNNLSINKVPLNTIRDMDSLTFAKFTADNINNGKPMQRSQFEKYVDSMVSTSVFHFTPGNYKNKAAYDSMLALGIKKHNWIERTLTYKQIEINEKLKQGQGKFLSVFIHTLTHSFPQMFFVSLPLFALILKLLYVRKKQYYFVDHSIFSIYFYIFVFIAMLLLITVGSIQTAFHWNWLRYIRGIIGLSIFFYLYKSLRNFYEQRRGKTIFKFILLNIFSMCMGVILFVVFIFFSLFKI